MGDDAAKKKPAKGKANTSETGVLAALPATRPSRLSRHSRTDAPAPAPVAKKPAASKRKAAAKPKAAPRRKPEPVANIADAPARPQAVRAGSPSLADRPAAAKTGKRTPAKAPSGTEVVTTVVQAAGELAQVGLTVSGQILKRAVEKLPKP